MHHFFHFWNERLDRLVLPSTPFSEKAHLYELGKSFRFTAETLSVKFLIDFFFWRCTKQVGNPGFVYFIESDPGVYKIGRSVDVSSRMNQMFPVLLPFTPKLKLEIPTKCPEWLEYAFHKAFWCERVNGEWFRLTPERFSAIEHLTKARFFQDMTEEAEE